MFNYELYKIKAEKQKKVFGFNPTDIAQGSDEWKWIKLGVISASNVHKVLINGKGRTTYMRELIAQVATAEMPEISSRHLEWGKNNELAARSAFEFSTGLNVYEVPFVFKELKIDCPLSNYRVGVSPDGLIAGESKGLELKCPSNSTVFLDFVLDGTIKKEYIAQCQFTMWALGLDSYYFACYDPRMRGKMFHKVELVPDKKMFNKFDIEIPRFIKEFDQELSQLGIIFGSQWA
jgi:hypothetical protein